MQRLRAAVPPPPGVLDGIVLAAELGRRLGLDLPDQPPAVFADMAGSRAAFAGLTWAGIGERGVRPEPAPGSGTAPAAPHVAEGEPEGTIVVGYRQLMSGPTVEGAPALHFQRRSGIEISHDDAQELGVATGDRVEVSYRRHLGDRARRWCSGGCDRASCGWRRRCRTSGRASCGLRPRSRPMPDGFIVTAIKSLVLVNLVMVMFAVHDLVRAAADRPLPGAPRPQPRRAVRPAAADRRPGQADPEGEPDPGRLERLPVPGGAGDLAVQRADGVLGDAVRRPGHDPRHRLPDLPVDRRSQRRPAAGVRARLVQLLRVPGGRLVVQLQVLAVRLDARRLPAGQLRGEPGAGRDRRRDDVPDAVADRHRRRPAARRDLVHRAPVRRLRDLPAGIDGRGQPHPVRPAGGRGRAGGRLPHRVRRHALGDVPERRVRRR